MPSKARKRAALEGAYNALLSFTKFARFLDNISLTSFMFFLLLSWR